MAKKTDITGKIADKSSPGRKGTSILSEFKQFFGQDSIYQEYEVLLSDKDLWALMQIPFSPELAEVTEEISELAKPAVEKKVVISSKDEQIIRETVARQLHKAPSQLTNEDYQNIMELDLSDTSLTELDYLKEKGLTNLKALDLDSTQVSDLEPIKDLKNLQELSLISTQVSDLEPIKNLTNLITLWLINCENITDEQVKDLKKALPELEVYS
jgi:hypothetical protein